MYLNEFNPDLYQGKYRIKSTRLKNWDYSGDGWYFITICTKNMVNYFGDVRDFIMGLSDIGCIAHEEWVKTGELRKNVILDEFVVMPNHVHGIVIIDNPNSLPEPRRDAPRRVSTNECLNKFGPLIPNSLSSIINQFKGAVKRWCNKNGYPNFQWQPRFYDHIIEYDKELFEIREYIYYNPQMWERDRNKSGLWM